MTNRIRATWIISWERGRLARVLCGLTVTIVLGFAMLLCFAEVGHGLVYGAPLEDTLSQTTSTVMAVVRNQGAALYDRPGGEPVQTLAGGALVSVRLRSQDELWVLIQTRDQIEGWVEIKTLLATGLNRLPVEAPTPTAQPTGVDAPLLDATTPEPEVETDTTVTPEATATPEAAETPTLAPSAEATPTAQPTGVDAPLLGATTPEPEAETDTTAMTDTTQPTTAEPTSEPTSEPTPAGATPESIPTPTSTPFVPPAGPNALTLARINGANLWRSEDGSLVAQFEAGKRLNAAFRTADSDWYFVYDDSGVHGWAMAAEILVVNGSSLPIEDITNHINQRSIAQTEPPADEMMPQTATPTPTDTSTPTVAQYSGAQYNSASKVIITVNSFGARLNVRAGPSTEFEIVAKAVAGVTFNGIGRNEAGDWIQVTIADLPSGVGWVSASYVTAAELVDVLPVVEE